MEDHRELGSKEWVAEFRNPYSMDGTGFNLDSNMSVIWPWYHHELVHEDSFFFLKVLFLYIQYEGALWGDMMSICFLYPKERTIFCMELSNATLNNEVLHSAHIKKKSTINHESLY